MTQGLDASTSETADFQEVGSEILSFSVGAGQPRWVVLRSIDSTNRLARLVARGFARDHLQPRATCFLAHEQTAGRGRLGRNWVSTAGEGLYLTVLLPLGDRSPAELSTLPLCVGLATKDVLDRVPGLSGLALKWPNDILVDGRKLVGILIEVIESQGQRSAAIGIGVNVAQPPERLPDPNAVSIAVLAAPTQARIPSLAELARSVAASVIARVEARLPISELLAEYREASLHRVGDELQWSGSRGLERGVFEGFAEDGAILLRNNRGLRKVSAGDVLLTAGARSEADASQASEPPVEQAVDQGEPAEDAGS